LFKQCGKYKSGPRTQNPNQARARGDRAAPNPATRTVRPVRNFPVRVGHESIGDSSGFHYVQTAMTRIQPHAVLEISRHPGPRVVVSPGLAPDLQPAVSLFAFTMIGLGILALIYGDFAMVWQPVAPWVPGRTALAYGSGVLMLICGAGLLIRDMTAWSVRILFPYLILWALLKVPALVVAPQIEGVWLGFGELAVLLSGGWILFARYSALRPGSILDFATSDRGVRIAKYLFAVWVIPIGLSHFFYVKETIDLIPSWIPFRIFWAYLTGAGHIAAGLGVLFSVVPSAAAAAEAGMLTIITLLVWVPAVLAAPRSRMPWTAFWISSVITAAVWVVAQEIWQRKPADAIDRESPERLANRH
jgi:uncharacterized membrane protein